jgi:DNA-binding transcriptional regulator LsrR (DeoR family)
VPVRIAVAGGPSKVRPMLGALRGGMLTSLVTDQATAEAIVALDEREATP